MLNSFRVDDKAANSLRLNLLRVLSWVVVVMFIAFLSAEYFYGWLSMIVVLGVLALVCAGAIGK